MATITASTTYTDGANLDIAGHNANIFSTTSGKGVLSEPNGGLEQANLFPGSAVPLELPFTIRDEHVMSEEAVMGRSEGTTAPTDIYSNAFGVLTETSDAYVPVGGLCQRVYAPYDISSMVWQWSFYAAVFRPAVHYIEDTQDTRLVELAMRLYVDGIEYPAYRRFLPCTAYFENGGTPTSGTLNYDAVGASWFDITKLMKNVSKGWHELTIRLFMPRMTNPQSDLDEGPTLQSWVGMFGPNSPEVTCKVHTRVTLGNRSVRCVMFK